MEGEYLRDHGELVVVADDRVAKPHFDVFIDLVTHAPQDLFAGDMVALHSAMDTQRSRGVDADDEVEMAGGAAFKEQGGFADGIGIAAGEALDPTPA